MSIHRREFSHSEIERFYSPRTVYEIESHFLIRPLNDSEGPIVLEIPKILPITNDGDLVDLTLAYEDVEHSIDEALEVSFTGDVSLRFGCLDTQSSAICQRLILDDIARPDTVQLIVHHHQPNAWGGSKLPTMPQWLVNAGGVLLHERVYLHSPEHIDFWLLHIDRPTDKLHRAINVIRRAHRCKMFG